MGENMKNKTYTLRFNVVNRYVFEAIRSGKKKIETRTGSPKYFNLQTGDKLIFVCGKDKFSKKVKKVMKFKSVKALHKVYKPEEINPRAKTIADSENIYYSFPGYKEKIKKYGLVALELK